MLTNRQPTLHRPGLMAHRARVLQVRRCLQPCLPSMRAALCRALAPHRGNHVLHPKEAASRMLHLCTVHAEIPINARPARQ